MIKNIEVHPAYPELPEVGFLTTLAIQEMSYPLFGTTNLNQIHQYIQALWKHKRNRFSHDWSWVAHADGEVSGLITAMPAKQLNRADKYTFLHILQMKQWQIFPHFYNYAKNIRALLALEEAYDDEFHISLLSVKPEYHRQGIASLLLQHIEAIAQHHGYNKLSLTVKQTNTDAQRLYTKSGYTIETAINHEPYHLYRMVKPLT